MRIRSSSDSGSVIGSLIVTIILWIAMAFGAYFIKPLNMQKEPEYVEISITLSDFPSLETGEPEIKEIEPEPVPPIERTEPVEPQNTETQAAQSEQMPQPKPVTQTAAEPQPAQPQPVQTLPAVAETTAVQQTVPATTQPQQTHGATASAPASQSQASASQPKPQNTTPVQAQTPAPQQQPKPAVQEQNAQQVDPTPKTEIVQAVDSAPKETTKDTAAVPPVTTTQETVEQTQTKPVTTENLSTVENNPSKKISWDDFDWDNMEGTYSPSSTNVAKTNPVNNNSADGVAGAAGIASTNTQPTQTNYTAGGRQVDNSSESRNVSEATENIRKAAADGSGSGTQTNTNSPDTEISGNETDFNWTGNSNPRKRIRPTEEPFIRLSSESEKKIDRELELTISIIVSGVGDIPIDSIKISPLLQWPDVMDDIKQYISRYWRFEPDPKDQSGTATVKYKIKVKQY